MYFFRSFSQLHPDSELPDAEPIKRPDIPFTPDKPKKASAVAGKYGSGYSTAKHLAKQAMKKQKSKAGRKPVAKADKARRVVFYLPGYVTAALGDAECREIASRAVLEAWMKL